VRAAGARPERAHIAFLDMEHEVAAAFARRFLRADLPAGTAERMARVRELLSRVELLSRYTKKLDTEWGLSRLSHAMLATTVPAVLVAAFMTLAYGEGAVQALGTLGAAALGARRSRSCSCRWAPS
jgi:hypothetical protein